MKKRIVSLMLVGAMVFTSIPMSTMAKTSEKKYGDVNGDGEINVLDLLTLKQQIADMEPKDYVAANADVNGDGKADFTDVLFIKKYIAEYDITLGPEVLTVRFYDGERLIDALPAEKGSPLGEVPSVAKSSKENATLLGYYKDPEFTEPFYAEDPVTESMDVYAKYQELESTEALNVTSFAQMDQEPDVTFSIKRESGENPPESAAVLTVKDGSAAVKLDISDSDEDGVYTVSAPEGFNKGCSYELNLADGWVFDGKESTIRTAAFSIKMEQVENLEMSEDIKYVKDTDDINYTVTGTQYAGCKELTDDIVSSMEDSDKGAFEYDKADELSADDIICVYVGTDPRKRKADDGKSLLDPAVYVKVSKVEGKVVTFEPLDENDQSKLYEVPDNFPIKVEEMPAADEGTVNLKQLDTDMYRTMLGDDGTPAKAREKIAKGDFLTMYVSQEDLTSEDAAYYAQITKYESETGEITYKKTTRQAILESMDLNADVDLSGDDYITEEEKKEIEKTVLYQLQNSDFTAGAAVALSDMLDKAAVVDEAVTSEADAEAEVQGYTIDSFDAAPLALANYNIAGKFQPSEDVDVSVELITKGDQLHYNNGVQLAVTVKANFEADTEDGKIEVPLSATFVQEVVIQPSVRGSIVTKKILFVPVPTGVQVNSTVDIKSYTAFSFNAQIYTVEDKDDRDTWTKIKDLLSDNTLVEGLKGADKLNKVISGLNKVGDVMTKIEELQEKVDEASEKKEQIEGYKADIDTLWSFLEENNIQDRETWKTMGESLGKSNIAADLMDMMNLTTETEASAEYLKSMQDLMNKYSETVQQDTSWVQLVNKEIASAKINFYGLVIGVETNFVVRTDMSIAIGSNLEYEVGKRYNFWFKIGLFKPEAGNSTMDLIDEHFRFQFYCMGRLGVKAGVNARLYVAIGSGKLASVGISAEMGPYVKLYGFFVYEYEKMRPANRVEAVSSERMAGALFMEFGLYFSLGFDAKALGNLFSYSYDFIDAEIPLLTAGKARYYYNNTYSPEPDEIVRVKDDDGNSSNGIDMTAPDSIFALSYVDLNTGIQGSEALSYDKYNVTLSNSHFKFDKDTGKISVDVPEGERYMECAMTITYLGAKLAFSQYDMSVTVPLVWTNLSDAELSEFYTASVRVGNKEDGYQTVWSKKVRKNESFDLPTDEEIKELIGWNGDKYEEGTGYGDTVTTGQTLIDNKVFDYNVNYKKYKVTVEDIQNEDGTTESRDYYAKFGETFDFSDLAATKTCDKEKSVYTKFANVTTDAKIVENNPLDLTAKINKEMAATLAEGNVTAKANYVDNSATITYTFTGIDHKDVTQIVEKGTTPDLSAIEDIVSDEGLAIKDISPEFGRADASKTYQVVCGELVGPEATIEFDSNGGSSVAQIVKVEGSLVGTLPTPVRDGYTFGGWFTDNGTFKKAFAERKMPTGTTKLYAMWTANQYEVTFNVNDGNELDEADKTKKVTYDKTYGQLPTPEKTGYGFRGWYTAAEGGDEITAETTVKITADQTLYAHWEKLVEIDRDVFDFGDIETYTYEKGVERDVEYTFDTAKLDEGSTLTADDFTFKFMRQGDSDYVDKPVKAGTYNVTVSRKGDNKYAKFEQTYEAIMTINKADRTIEANGKVVEAGYTYLKIDKSQIDDLAEEALVNYTVNNAGGGESYVCASGTDSDTIDMLSPERNYTVYVSITNDENYNDLIKAAYIENAATKTMPSLSWDSFADTSWYNSDDTTFTITTAAQLAGVSRLVANNTTFSGKKIVIGADIDMSQYRWVPIGAWGQFQGTFDGGYHKLSGMFSWGGHRQGLIGYSYNANVYNVYIEDSYFNGDTYVGSIIGELHNSTVSNCVSHAVVEGNKDVGGIVGYSVWGGVYRSENFGRVSGNDCIGGIAGWFDSTKSTNCANFGPVYGSGDSQCGGLLGHAYHNDVIYNSYNVGTVYTAGGDSQRGAILGYSENKYSTNWLGIAYGSEGMTMDQCYYLSGCAGSKGAYGKSGGKYAIKSQKTAAFSGPNVAMNDNCEENTKGKTLLEKLNAWTLRCDKQTVWEIKEGADYPTIIGMPQ